MPYYRQVGDVSVKRHTVHRRSDGHRYSEQLITQAGFSGNSSLLYHVHSPSAIEKIEPVDVKIPEATPDQLITPRHLRTQNLPDGEDLFLGRQLLLANPDLRVSFARASGTSPLYSNASGDELVFIQAGHAVLESVFGRLEASVGDYVVVPSGAIHRWVVTPDAPVEAFIVEATGHIGPPRQYLSTDGQFAETSPYCERDMRAPSGLLAVEGEAVPVIIRNRGGLTQHTYRHHPFDVVGWDGCVYPWALNILDFEPLVGRLHKPPPVHQTFDGPGFVIFSFVPRLLDFHPDAVKVPSHHANVDCDEVIFYSSGDFMSRAGLDGTGSGIGVGSISFHPSGFVHGPQPGGVEASFSRERTEEVAVMIDTFKPLDVTDTARDISAENYPFTWSGA